MVAVVNVRPLRSAPAVAAESEAVEAAECGVCAPPVIAAAPRKPRQLIDLSAVPSSMEQRAASWKKP